MPRSWMLPACALLVMMAFDATTRADEKLWVFVGTYTQGTGSKGIYRLELDPATGTLSAPVVAAETVNPSFLAIHPSKKSLYAVGEISGGAKSGAVVAFALDPKSGTLTALNKQPSSGSGPCHLVVDHTGQAVLAANYGSGSVSCRGLDASGSLAPEGVSIQHEGRGTDPKRQEGPHAHSINLDARNRFAFAADLGLDKVIIYNFDPKHATLTPHGSVAIAPGSGPRHFAFHPDGKHAYVINEMACTVTAFDYDADKGELKTIQTIPTLPRAVAAGDSTAEVQVHPSGKFLYGSNRGHDSITVFAIDAANGKLTTVQNEPTGGKNPRNFAIDPSGRWLLAENQDSNSIVVFAIDPQTGKLKATGTTASVPKPVCIKFVAQREG